MVLPSRLPHARGGVSAFTTISGVMYWSSPRTWGCFSSPALSRAARRGLPHARGGVSTYIDRYPMFPRSSPRTWGCFTSTASNSVRRVVFPTHVGVFPRHCRASLPGRCLPHARGGVSPPFFIGIHYRSSSPRTWGCFDPGSMGMSIGYVFPTHVGVFLRFVKMPIASIRLPHARGGVSPAKMSPMCRSGSSPRTWGCFTNAAAEPIAKIVFPTHVGVFPELFCWLRYNTGLPHARGGVSIRATSVAA